MLANLHPYFTAGLGGILIGLASWLLWWGLGRIAGVSSIASEVIASPVLADSWRWAFLAGLILGGCLLGQGLEIPTLPTRPLYLLFPAGLLVGVAPSGAVVAPAAMACVAWAGCRSGLWWLWVFSWPQACWQSP
jgi:hypothetical protein